ncbi:MauE/DoxX family redox-associated membrane protein [Rothia uropygialis]|uniref:MauE/DoxX family redox-associated membrane protein n=1 Tax=Kocuria sp. 36 TaxID=1415402 RepID=UPI00101DB76E|nr:MauE/DoxX family redox-associated membrane protein [Kocuria sp. 36]
MTALLFPALILAVVLWVSGLAKLRDRSGVAAAFKDLKVPSALDRPWLRAAFPWGEVALGVLLLVTPGWFAPVVALIAFALFAAYWALIYQALGFDQPVACSCFGKANSDPVTHWTLWRNTALVLLSAFWLVTSFFTSSPGLFVQVSGNDLLWIVGLACAGGTLFLAISPASRRAAEAKRGSARQYHPVEGADAVVSSIQTGSAEEDDAEEYVRRPIPGLVVKNSQGELVALPRLASVQARLLLYVSPGCGSCTEIIASAPEWAKALDPSVGVHLVTASRQEVLETVADESLWESALYDVGDFMADLLGLAGTPSAVLLGADGLLAGGPVNGAPDITIFVQDIQVELEAARQEPSPRQEPA